MTRPAPAQEWWTSAEIAEARLIDMPSTRQGVEIAAKDWRTTSLARRRDGRGGGWEYHWTLLPMRAQAALLKTASQPAVPAPAQSRDEAWSWFEGLPEKVKEQARKRLQIVQVVEGLERQHGKHLSVHMTALAEKVSARTIWSWFAMIDCIPVHDRLAYLAPRHRAGSTERPRRMSREFLNLIKDDYLRPTRPSFSSCYRRQARVALKNGWDVPPEKTMRRAFDREVSKETVTLAHYGVDALKAKYPPQVRDKTALRPMEMINGDIHKWDLWVQWPAGLDGKLPDPIRPHMCAFQDVFSGQVLSFRVDQTANSHMVQLCAGDMIEDWGIPEGVLLDNGREFAAKKITGGAKSRYRFKIKEDDVLGLFAQLGCQIHWATPYSGQSKPIERAFRDMCDAIAKDPRFDGAWTGNRPDAKPEDYRSKAIPLETFLKVLAEGIEEHNTRQGRRSEVAFGRSFAEVFAEAYETTPIRKATAAQRRLWLMGAENVRANTRTAAVKFRKNEYWAEWMHKVAGEKLVIRFDPADLHAGIHIYANDGRYLGEAPCRFKGGFKSLDDCRLHQKTRKDWLRAQKAALAAHRTHTAVDLGLMLDELAADAPAAKPKAKAKVVRPMFGAAKRRPEPPPMTGREAEVHQAMVTELDARRTAAPAEDSRDRFKRALDLSRAVEAGQMITVDQSRWLEVYRTSAEYRAEKRAWDEVGDALFG